MYNPNQRSFAQFARNSEGEEDIRKESFGTFLKTWFFPFFVLKSFIFFITIFEIIMYSLSLMYGGILRDGHFLLAPTLPALSKFGMKVPYFIQHGEVGRFLTFTFLHASLDHIIFNSLSQLIIGCLIENLTGFLKTAGLYFLSSIGGGLFSSLISDKNSVGASVAVFGLLGGYICYVLLNWKRGNPQTNFVTLLMLSFMVLISLSVSAMNPTVDNYGHIGGLIYGFFLFPVLVKPEDENDCACCSYNTWKMISYAFCVIFYIGGFVLFFFVRKYPEVKF